MNMKENRVLSNAYAGMHRADIVTENENSLKRKWYNEKTKT